MALSTVPSLSSDFTTATTSIDTGLASDLVAHDILEDDGSGALVVPQATTLYTCLFPILNCHETFTNTSHWKTHVLSHFHAHEPPSTARCPICPTLSIAATTTHPPPTVTFTSSRRYRAWDALLDHIDAAHYQHGHTLAGTRPDFELLRYLYVLGIIGEEQLKVVQLGVGMGSAAYTGHQEGVRARMGREEEPFCAVFSRRRERRLRERREAGRVVV